MQPGFHFRRIPILRSSSFAVLLLAALLQFSTLHAQSFTPSTSAVTITSVVGGGGWGAVNLHNNTHSNVQLYLSLVGTDASAFSLSEHLVYLGGGPNDSIVDRGVRIDFSPIAYKVHHALLIATDSNGTQDTIQLTGNGIGAGLYIYVRGQNDSVPVGQRECNDIVIVNGDAKIPVTITSISLGSTNVDYWTTHFITLDSSKVSLPVTINPKDSIKLTWCFAPTSNGFYWADSLIVHFTSIVGIAQKEATFLAGRSNYALAPDSECVLIDRTALDTIDFGTISPGTATSKLITYTNPSSAEIIIDSFSISGADAAHFSVDGDLGLPHYIYYRDSSVHATGWFRTSISDNYRDFQATATIYTTVYGTAITTCNRTFVLRGHTSYIAPPDTTKFDLAPDSTESATITDSVVGCKAFEVRNNTASSIRIDTIYMKSGAHMRVYLMDTLPDTIPPGGVRHGYICVLDSSQSTFNDTLVIVTEHAIVAMQYPVHWQRQVHLGVHIAASVTAPTLSVYPNPSSGAVSIAYTGMHDAKLEILDVLGRTVQTLHSSGSAMNWNGHLASGELAAKGAYIARVTGINDRGQLVTQSGRIVIVR